METGIINAIRSRAALVVGIIFFSLLLFIASTALSDFQSLFTGRDSTIGEVAGKEIDVVEFDQRFQTALANYQQQSGAPIDDNLRRALSDQVWQQMVEETFFNAELASAGIEITPAEVKRLFLGPDESPVMRQIPDFVDQATGELRRDVIQNFLEASRSNPQLLDIRKQILDQVVRQRQQQIYFGLVKAAGVVTRPEAAARFTDDRQALSLEYLAVNYAALDDSTVKASDADLRRYYDAHKAEYKQEEDETTIKYVCFRKTPTAADSATALAEISDWRTGLAETKDDSSFVATRAFDAPPAALQPIALLEPRLQDIAAKNPVGTLLGPTLVGNAYEVVKVSGFAKDSLSSVKVRHIVIRPQGPSRLDSLRAQVKADSIARVATAANFATLVTQHSEDPNTRFTGGELGWVPRGRYGIAFDRALSRAGRGLQRRAIASNQGYHVIEVLDRDDRLVRLALLRREVYASTATLNDLERQAALLSTSVRSVDDLDSAAARRRIDVRTSPPLRPGSRDLPGLVGSTSVVNWALRSKKGDHSDPLETEDAYVVAIVSDKIEKGFQPFDQVKEDIRPKVISELKARQIRTKLTPLIPAANGDLERLRQAYGAGAYVSRADNVLFGSVSVPGLGTEPKVIGAARRLNGTVLSEPISGRSGVFIVRRSSEPAEVAQDSVGIEGLRVGLESARRSSMQSKVYQGLREAAAVADRRYQFGQ